MALPGKTLTLNNEAGLAALNLQVDMLYKDCSAVPPTTQETALAENGKGCNVDAGLLECVHISQNSARSESGRLHCCQPIKMMLIMRW